MDNLTLEKAGVGENLIAENPGFMTTNGDDLRLCADSPAWKTGFKPVPMEKIGPRKQAARSTLCGDSHNWRKEESGGYE